MAELADHRVAPLLPALPTCVSLPLPTMRLSLRGGPATLSAAGEALGLAISQVPCRSARKGARSALWLGPDEQLILAPLSEAPILAALLEKALHGVPHSFVDISHRQLSLRIDGSLAATLLNVGCPLDLDPSQFPVGMCTRTLLGKADIVLWRLGADSFHIEVWRSFAEYTVRFLTEAARELAF